MRLIATCAGGCLDCYERSMYGFNTISLVQCATTQLTIPMAEDSMLLCLRLIGTGVYTYVYVNEGTFVGSRDADNLA